MVGLARFKGGSPWLESLGFTVSRPGLVWLGKLWMDGLRMVEAASSRRRQHIPAGSDHAAGLLDRYKGATVSSSAAQLLDTPRRRANQTQLLRYLVLNSLGTPFTTASPQLPLDWSSRAHHTRTARVDVSPLFKLDTNLPRAAVSIMDM